MANEKISQLPAASTSSGSDLYPLVQGGLNKSITFTALQSALIGGGSVVSSLNSLTGALNLIAGTNVTIVPSGSSITISASGSGGGGISALTGDVTASGSGSVPATVAFVGGQTAAAVASATVEVGSATNFDIPSTLVLRDSSGNFSAGTVSAGLIGNVIGSVSGSSSSFTGSLAGDVTGTQGATSILSSVVTGKLLTGYVVGADTPILATDSVLQAFEKIQAQINSSPAAGITQLTGDVSATGPGSTVATVNSVGGSSAANIHSAELAANAATNLDTASTIVKRDSSGNFSAGTITATLNGNITGNSAGFTGLLVGDVTGTQTATVVSAIRGTTVSGTTGTGNVVFSASPTLTGTLTAGAANFSGIVNVVASSTSAFQVGTLAFDVDTVNGAIGVGTLPSTSSVVDVVNNSGTAKAIQATGYGSNVGFRGRYANGTLLSPTATSSGNILSFFSARGYGATAFSAAAVGVMNIVAAGNFTDTSMPTYIAFSTTPVNSVTSAEVMRVSPAGNLLIGTTTDDGTDKLQVNGSINTGAITATSETLTASSTDVLTINTTSFVFDSVNNALGIGKQPTPGNFIDATVTASADYPVLFSVYGTGGHTTFRSRSARGTFSSPTATQAGDTLGSYGAVGYGASQFATNNTGAIHIVANENFTNTSNATYLNFLTAATGTIAGTERMRINSTGNILMGTTIDNATDLLQVASGIISNYHKFAGSTSGYVEIIAPSTVTTYTAVLPAAQGSAGSYLQNDGSGNLSWASFNANIDGGTASSIYTTAQIIAGGTP